MSSINGLRSTKDLEDHIKKLEGEYDCLNDQLAHGESNGFNAESGTYLAIISWLKNSWMIHG